MKLNLEIDHELTQAEALRRIQDLLPQLKRQHADQFSNLRENWVGSKCAFSFTASGLNVSGTLKVNAHDVEIEGDLPWFARPFKDNIETAIRQKAEELLR